MTRGAKRASRHLGPRELAALETLGDRRCPARGDLPAFSRLGCLEHVDRILDHLPPADVAALRGLLAVLGRLPPPVRRAAAAAVEGLARLPGRPFDPFRVAAFGLRGILLSLYYSGEKGSEAPVPSPLETIGYRVSVYTGDLEASGE